MTERRTNGGRQRSSMPTRKNAGTARRETRTRHPKLAEGFGIAVLVMMMILIAAIVVSGIDFARKCIAQNAAEKKQQEQEAEPTATTAPTATEAPTMTPTPTLTPTPTPVPTRDPNKKQIAFSFDDGPYTRLTKQFVDKLKEYNGRATWFVVGNRIDEESGAALQYADANGNEIAIHGYTHQYYYDKCDDATFQAELKKTEEAIRKYIDKPIKLMRPIGGNITAERIAASPYAVILWSNDSQDWRYKKRDDAATIKKNVDTIVNNVMKTAKDGDIILMHEIYDNSYEAFCILIEKLHQEGFEFVTVSELLGNAEAGVAYHHR